MAACEGSRYVVADVFTDRPLTGNQLAVFTDARDVDAETMQALALEMRFSETVFVLPAEGDGDVRIRIFTPRSSFRLRATRSSAPHSSSGLRCSGPSSASRPGAASFRCS